MPRAIETSYVQEFAKQQIKMFCKFLKGQIELTSHNGEQTHVNNAPLETTDWSARLQSRRQFKAGCLAGVDRVKYRTVRPELGPKVVDVTSIRVGSEVLQLHGIDTAVSVRAPGDTSAPALALALALALAFALAFALAHTCATALRGLAAARGCGCGGGRLLRRWRWRCGCSRVRLVLHGRRPRAAAVLRPLGRAASAPAPPSPPPPRLPPRSAPSAPPRLGLRAAALAARRCGT